MLTPNMVKKIREKKIEAQGAPSAPPIKIEGKPSILKQVKSNQEGVTAEPQKEEVEQPEEPPVETPVETPEQTPAETDQPEEPVSDVPDNGKTAAAGEWEKTETPNEYVLKLHGTAINVEAANVESIRNETLNVDIEPVADLNVLRVDDSLEAGEYEITVTLFGGTVITGVLNHTK